MVKNTYVTGKVRKRKNQKCFVFDAYATPKWAADWSSLKDLWLFSFYFIFLMIKFEGSYLFCLLLLSIFFIFNLSGT